MSLYDDACLVEDESMPDWDRWWDSATCQAAQRLAASVRAEHDPEPVTGEWLESVGFREPYSGRWILHRNGRTITFFPTTNSLWFRTVGENVELTDNATRGDVRVFCDRLLGVVLREGVSCE